MPITRHPAPGSRTVDDNHIVVAVPVGAFANPDAPTLAEIDATTNHDVTYSFVPGGFEPTSTQETIPDPRHTLGASLQKPGRKTPSFQNPLEWVFGTEDDVADPILEEGSEWHFVVRDNVPYTAAFAAQQLVEIHTVRIGERITNRPTNGIFTRRATATYTRPVVREYALPSA
ncbi:MAG: hypothetical protein FJW64_16490 [Actinobacteria bacterium]|nr:hypothetical protein [Actinomycetota bacterium]